MEKAFALSKGILSHLCCNSAYNPSGINVLAFRRLKTYTHCAATLTTPKIVSDFGTVFGEQVTTIRANFSWQI